MRTVYILLSLSLLVILFQNCGAPGSPESFNASLSQQIQQESLKPTLAAASFDLTADANSLSSSLLNLMHNDSQLNQDINVNPTINGTNYILSEESSWVLCHIDFGGSLDPNTAGTTVLSYQCAFSHLNYEGDIALKLHQMFMDMYDEQSQYPEHLRLIEKNGNSYSISDSNSQLSCDASVTPPVCTLSFNSN